MTDDSNGTIKLALWGKDAEDFTHTDHTIVLVEGAKVEVFNGIKKIPMGLVQINPECAKAHQLRSWFEKEKMKYY